MRRVNISVRDANVDTFERAKVKAAENGRSLSDVVSSLLAGYISDTPGSRACPHVTCHVCNGD